MDPLEQSLHLIKQAQLLEQSILGELKAGNFEGAGELNQQREQLISSLPLDQFTEALPPALEEALRSLHDSNQTLATQAKNMQTELGQQLTKMRKGRSASDVYQSFNKE